MTRAEVRANLDRLHAENEARRRELDRQRKVRAYTGRRRREMPQLLQATRRKLQMLENEARSYGLNPAAM